MLCIENFLPSPIMLCGWSCEPMNMILCGVHTTDIMCYHASACLGASFAEVVGEKLLWLLLQKKIDTWLTSYLDLIRLLYKPWRHKKSQRGAVSTLACYLLAASPCLILHLLLVGDHQPIGLRVRTLCFTFTGVQSNIFPNWPIWLVSSQFYQPNSYIVRMREDQTPPPRITYSIASSPRRRRWLTSTTYRTKPRYDNLTSLLQLLVCPSLAGRPL